MNNSGLLIHAVLDEIALEGLEGITIKSLWIRLSVRLNLTLPLNENFCNQIWSFLLKQNSLFYYELPEPRPDVKVFVRGDFNDNDDDNEEFPFTVYKFNPISIEKLRGSCQDFETRTIIDWNFIQNKPLSEIYEKFGDKLVIVGSQQMREWAIFPETIPPPKDLTLFQYCILERIARARYNGEKTNGKFSMNDLMDASKSFYIRKVLLRHKLIIRQPYFERCGQGSTSGSLLHLPKFHTEYKTKPMILTEKIVEILKSEPNCMIEYTKLRQHFDKTLYGPIKRLLKDNLFQKFVSTDIRVPYRTLYPNSSQNEWQKKQSSKERGIHVMQLRDSNIDVNDLWPRENIADDNDDVYNDDTLDINNQWQDETLIRQTYKYIEKSGKNGISSADIAQYIGLTKLNCRLILRNLEKLKLLSKYYVDRGRQPIPLYVTNENLPNTVVTVEKDEKIINPIETKDNVAAQNVTTEIDIAVASIKIPPKDDPIESSSVSECSEKTSLTDFDTKSIVSDSKLPDGWQHIDVIVKIELIERFNNKQIVRLNSTARITERLNIILRAIKKNLIIPEIHQLVIIVNTEETKMGYDTTMCRKSIYRLLSTLSIEKRIRLWQILLTYETQSKTCLFMSDATINTDNRLFISMLEREKEKFLRRILSAKIRIQAMDKQRVEDDIAARKSLNESTKKTHFAPKKKLYHSNSTTDDRMLNYGITPKFIKMRTLHEFMFYLLYADNKAQQIIKPLMAIEHWKTVEPLVDYDELIQQPLPPIYSINLDWTTFVPPLIENPEYGNGWILMSDLILRLPLSIFVKLLNITYEIPGLDEYLDHPIRKHFLLKYVPPLIQNELLKGRKHLFTINETMRRLCCIGLTQIGPQLSKDKDQLFIYLNRRASLLDTISSEPGYYKCAAKDYPQLDYYFAVNENIHRYWQQLYQICTNTRLNRRNSCQSDNNESSLKSWNLQPKLIEHMSPRLITDVEQLDTGEIPGDHLGAGGLDSSLFSHLIRNWSLTKYKIKARSSADDDGGGSCDDDTTTDNNEQDQQSSSGKGKKKISCKRATVRQGNNKKRLMAINKRPAKNVIIVKRNNNKKTKPQPKSVSRDLIKKAAKKLRHPLYNDIDKMALRQMTKLRVDWSAEEDNLILFCKVAMLYLCPNPRKQGIPMCTVRDILHWLLKSNDKTSRACQRRIVYMMKNPIIASNVHMCLLEVQHNTAITRAFPSNLYERVRQKFTHEDGFLRAMSIVFVDLIAMLRRYFVTLTKTKLDESQKLLVPDTIAEFKEMYIEHSEDYQNECIKYTKPKKRNDIEVDVLSALIHSSVCCARDKTSWSVQLYDIYKDYPDRLLLMAMEKVRNYQMISAKKTVNKSRLKATTNLPLSANPYHLSVTYQHQFMTSISYDIFYDIYQCIKEFFATSEQIIKFTNITPGRCIAFIQMLHNHNIEFTIEAPPKMLVIDKSLCKGTTALERTCSKFRQIFENIPNLVSDNIHNTATTSNRNDSIDTSDGNNVKKDKKRVMINTEHEKIEYHMSPVEKLMKLDDSMYHFYCLFRKIGMTFDLKSIEIELPGRYCSFDCVLRETEPILTMIDIIKLDAGNVMKQIKCDGQHNGIHDTMTIGINNILVIFNLLVSKLFNSDDFDDISDYGILNVSMEILNDNTENDLWWFSPVTKVDSDDGNNSCQDDFIDNKLTRNVLGSYYLSAHESTDKIHNYFYVQTSKILINPSRMVDKNCSDEENRLKVHQLSVEKKSMVLKKTVSDAIWEKNPLDNDSITETLTNINYTIDEIKLTLEVLKFIELKEDMGAENTELVAEFSDKSMLLRSVRILTELNVIMRAGIYEFVFIHWKYVTPWIISTYNIKRLEKESMEPVSYHLLKISDKIETDDAASTSTKRKRNTDENGDEDDNEQTAKLLKTTEEDEPIPSTSRGITRLDKVTIQKTDDKNLQSTLATSSRTTFSMRVNPWIRVNGGLNRRVLDKWLGSILTHCIANPGSTVLKICQRFNLQQPIHIRLLLEYLELLECIELKTIKSHQSTLWSTCNTINIEPATELDTIDQIFVNVNDNAVTKMSTFIGDKQYAMDFI